jgi:hypothetical protein
MHNHERIEMTGLIPGEVSSGDRVIYDGDEKVQVPLTDQRVLIVGRAYTFDRWHATLLRGIHLQEFTGMAFPARVFHKQEVAPVAFVPGVLGVGRK